MENCDRMSNDGDSSSDVGEEEDEEEEEEDASSTTTGDLAPRMREQFANLSSALVETSENLHTFEFMLGQYRWDILLLTFSPTSKLCVLYRRLAAIRPMIVQSDSAQPMEQQNDLDQTQKLELLLQVKNTFSCQSKLSSN